MDPQAEEQFLNKLLSDLNDDKLVLPTLPEIALKVNATLENEESSMADVAKIIAQDAALSARLIQVVNSPLLRSPIIIKSIDSAVMRLGSSMIRNLVSSMVMEQLFKAGSPATEKRLRATWQRSVAVSSTAMALSMFNQGKNKLKKEQAMLAGLVHDIGILPILSRAEEYPELLEDEVTLDRIITEAHTKVGAAILEKWNFPAELILVATEHENKQYDSKDGPDYVDLVIVAGLQSDTNQDDAVEEEDWSLIPAFSKLGLSAEVEIIDVADSADFAAAMSS